MNLLDKTFAERFVKTIFNVSVLFQVIFQRLVNFAVGYKYTNLSKRGKNFPQAFFH